MTIDHLIRIAENLSLPETFPYKLAAIRNWRMSMLRKNNRQWSMNSRMEMALLIWCGAVRRVAFRLLPICSGAFAIMLIGLVISCRGASGQDVDAIESTADLVGRSREDQIATPVNQVLTPLGRQVEDRKSTRLNSSH